LNGTCGGGEDDCLDASHVSIKGLEWYRQRKRR